MTEPERHFGPRGGIKNNVRRSLVKLLWQEADSNRWLVGPEPKTLTTRPRWLPNRAQGARYENLSLSEKKAILGSQLIPFSQPEDVDTVRTDAEQDSPTDKSSSDDTQQNKQKSK